MSVDVAEVRARYRHRIEEDDRFFVDPSEAFGNFFSALEIYDEWPSAVGVCVVSWLVSVNDRILSCVPWVLPDELWNATEPRDSHKPLAVSLVRNTGSEYLLASASSAYTWRRGQRMAFGILAIIEESLPSGAIEQWAMETAPRGVFADHDVYLLNTGSNAISHHLARGDVLAY